MLYHFLTTPDGTAVYHSEILQRFGQKQIRLYAEKWNEEHNDFDSIKIYLPDFQNISIVGFSQEEATDHITHLRQLEEIIWECAYEASKKQRHS